MLNGAFKTTYINIKTVKIVTLMGHITIEANKKKIFEQQFLLLLQIKNLNVLNIPKIAEPNIVKKT